MPSDTSAVEIRVYNTGNSVMTINSVELKRLNYTNYTPGTGMYNIATKMNSNFVVDVADGSMADGGNIQLYTKVNNQAQKWKFISVGNGYYKIESVYSGKVLDIQNGSFDAANVQQHTWNSGGGQMWKILASGDSPGSYLILSQKGTVLDLDNAVVADHTNIKAWPYNGSDAQLWLLQPTS